MSSTSCHQHILIYSDLIDLNDGDKVTLNKYRCIRTNVTYFLSYKTRKNISKKVIYESVTPCETINNHDAPFVVLNTKKQRVQSRYKFVRDEKSFNLENYINDSSQLPLSTVYSFDDPDDQVETLNKLITDYHPMFQ